MTRNVGVIGLGAMGIGVVRSLLRAGFAVHACDVRQNVLDAFAKEGGVVLACGTVAPEFAVSLGKRLAEENLKMLDAPVQQRGQSQFRRNDDDDLRPRRCLRRR